jgi:hypothetical protein
MNWKLKLFQTFGEISIPVLGYFFWSWTLFDIALFYLLDFIMLGVLFHVKLKKIEEFHEKKQRFFPLILIQLLLFLIIIFLSHVIFSKIIVDFNFFKEFKRFFFLKDMGLPQGYFLFPLIVYAAYLNFKMNFISTKLYTKTTLETLKKQHFVSLFLTISMLGVLFGISHFFHLNAIPILVLLILSTSCFSLFWKRV